MVSSLDGLIAERISTLIVSYGSREAEYASPIRLPGTLEPASLECLGVSAKQSGRGLRGGEELVTA